jgi:hypothetical protein
VKQFADNCNADTFRDFSLRNFEFIYNTVMGRAEAATGKPVEQVS